MNLQIPQRRFDPQIPELMDIADHNAEILRDDLRNLRTINKYFGGLHAVEKSVIDMIARIEKTRTIQILDLATGSADHPIALADLARSLKRSIRITAIERNPITAAIARERTSSYSEISINEGDILSIDFSNKSYDIVLCSLAIHHFSREDSIRILGMMTNLSRIGLIVNDLDRSWPAAWTAWLYTHLTTRNPITLNDSYVSVLRAYTPNELRTMANEAGVPHPKILRHPMFRLILIGKH